ncbi:MAG: squalene synthase HpnC [Planctomycetaceae bacterium]|jgi:squalene synthase HpnC|nr:squalene synthase HpnC [Planctomycetaceae bacterium]
MKSIVLFSGGLDSSLAVKILQEQGAEAVGLNIVTPFHDNSEQAQKSADALGIELAVHRTGDDYIQMLARPKWGYGKIVNPCLDCRIAMHLAAKSLMEQRQADFIATGDIIGQDPNGQMQHQLNLIERESGLTGLLLRPLCAALLPPAQAEKDGKIDRAKLFGYTGRGRGKLVVLAHKFGFKKIPPLSVRCLLCEKSYAPRVLDLFRHEPIPTDWDAGTLNAGRQIRIDEKVRAVVARNAEHCDKLEKLILRTDAKPSVLVKPDNFTGTSALVVGHCGEDDVLHFTDIGKKLIFQFTNPAKYDTGTAAFDVCVVPPVQPNVLRCPALAYCKRLTKSRYENFSVATFLLPKRLRKPFYAVYAYCRCSDDIGDEHNGSEEAKQQALQQFNEWEKLLNECFQFGKPVPKHPVFAALRQVAEEFQVPKQDFADLLTAFRRDQIQNRYETLEDLLTYCRCSANPVGRIVLNLVFAPEKPAQRQFVLSDSICTGLQLANFWQDIARDASIGRRYIPKEVAERFGVDIEQLQETPPFRAMLRELVNDARRRLLGGLPLLDEVPKDFRVDLTLFLRGGLAVCDAIERGGYNVLSKRPVVSKWTKLKLLWNAWLGGN